MSKPEVLLIDLSSLYWMAWHATKDAPMSEAASLTETAVRRAVGACEPGTLVAVCLDQGRSFRKDLLPEYKANREEKAASALAEMSALKDRLRNAGMWLVGADTFEADDIIATLTHAAVKAEHPVCIASADKDLLQLVGLSQVRQLRTYNNWDVWRNANVVEKFGVEPESLGDWLALCGDKSDNVPGVPSCGPVTATKLLIQHGDLDGIYRKIDALQVINGQVETKTPAAQAIATPAIVDKLWRHKADALLARKLVELRTDAPVKFEDIYKERAIVMTTGPDDVDLDAQGDIFAREDPTPAPATSGAGAASAETADAASASTATTEPASTATAEDVKTTGMALPPPSPVPETALVTVEYTKQLEPQSSRGALALGNVLYESRAFTRFPSPGSITATIMRGRELGVPAMASLDAFHFVAELGRILASWQLIRALAERDAKCKFFRWVSGDDKSSTWETWHADHPEPTRMTYTIEQAQRAGLVKTDKPKSAWMARPEEQLSKTCCCILARRVFSGAVLGLYSSEEMGDES